MRTVFAILTVLLLVTSVVALHSGGFGGYSGQSQRERRAEDPYSRQQYFGEGYYRDFTNFGSKGPNERLIKTGRKSAFSGFFNLDTNSFAPQGRNPKRISNTDPNMRGFARLDKSVELLPFESIELAGRPVLGKGAARIVSTGNQYGSVLNDNYPRTQVWIQAVNLPPLGDDKVYEGWLVDEDTGYSLSIGVLEPGSLTSQLFFEFNRKVVEFEAVMVTEEVYPDVNPSPGLSVLYGYFGDARNALGTPTSYFEERVR